MTLDKPYLNLPDLTDEELVSHCKKDQEYFGAIIERYERPLFRFVRRISYFEKEEIEDILQEVFIKVYKNINDFDNNLKFSSWIYRITRNHTIDVIRKSKNKSIQIDFSDSKYLHFLKDSANLGKKVENKDLLEKIVKIIRTLPLKYQEVMVLKFLEDKSYEEIMDILRKPKGSVAVLINRGRKKLKEEIEKQGIDLT